MDTAQITTVVVSLFATAILGGVGYWWYRRNRPIHTFIGVDFGAQSVQPRRIRNLFGPFHVKRADKTRVQFPVPQGFAHPRQDGRGTIFFGDMETGQLLKVHRGESLFEAVNGIFLEKAAADGRVEQVVSATKGNGLTLKHIMMGIGVVGVLVVIVIYQFAKGGGVT